MNNVLSDEFIKEHGIKTIQTIDEPIFSNVCVLVEFNDGEIIKKEVIEKDIINTMYVLKQIVRIRSRKKKLEKITDCIHERYFFNET